MGSDAFFAVNYSPEKIIHLYKRIPWNSISLKEHVASYYFLYFLNFGHINFLASKTSFWYIHTLLGLCKVIYACSQS